MTDQWLPNIKASSPSGPSVLKANLKDKIERKVKTDPTLQPLLDGFNAEILKFGKDQPQKEFINVLIDHLNIEHERWKNDPENYVYSPVENHPADLEKGKEEKDDPRNGDLLKDDDKVVFDDGEHSVDESTDYSTDEEKRKYLALEAKFKSLLELLRLEEIGSEVTINKLLKDMEDRGVTLTTEEKAKLHERGQKTRELEKEMKDLREELEKANAQANVCKLATEGKEKNIVEMREEFEAKLKAKEKEYNDANDHWGEQFRELKKTAEKSMKEKEEAKNTAKEAEEKLTQATTRHETELNQLRELSEEKARLYEKKTADDEARQSEKIKEFNRTLDGHLATNLELKLANTALELEKKTLQQTAVEKEEQLRIMRESKTSEEDIKNRDEMIESQNRLLENVRKEKDEALTRNEALLEQVRVITEEKQKIEEENNKNDAEMKSVREKNEQDVEDLEKARKENGELLTRVLALEAEKEELLKDYEKVGEKSKEVEAQYTQVLQSYSRAVDEVQSVAKERNDLQEENITLKIDITLLQENNSKLTELSKKYQKVTNDLQLDNEILAVKLTAEREKNALGGGPALTSDELEELKRLRGAVPKDVADQVKLLTQENQKYREEYDRLRIKMDKVENLGQIRYYFVDENFFPNPLPPLDYESPSFNPMDYWILTAKNLKELVFAAIDWRKLAQSAGGHGGSGSATLLSSGSALTLGQTVHRMGYSALVKQRVDGPNSLRLDFSDAKGGRRLAFTVNRLAPRVLTMGASPNLVADIGKKASHIDYRYVTQFDRDLIPSAGQLEVTRFNGTSQQNTAKYDYNLETPRVEKPYGVESMVEFKDGTRLYTTYVTASLYALNLIVVPYFTATPKATIVDDDSSVDVVGYEMV